MRISPDIFVRIGPEPASIVTEPDPKLTGFLVFVSEPKVLFVLHRSITFTARSSLHVAFSVVT